MSFVLSPYFQIAYDWIFCTFPDHAELSFINEIASKLVVDNDQKGIRVSLDDVSIFCGEYNEEYAVATSTYVKKRGSLIVKFQFSHEIDDKTKTKPFIKGPWKKDETTVYEPDPLNQVLILQEFLRGGGTAKIEEILKLINTGIIKAILMTIQIFQNETGLFPLFIDACYKILNHYPKENTVRTCLGNLLLQTTNDGSEILNVLNPCLNVPEAQMMIGCVLSPFSKFVCVKDPQKAFFFLDNGLKNSRMQHGSYFLHELAEFYYNGCCVPKNEEIAERLNKGSTIPLEKFNTSGFVSFFKSLFIGAIGFGIIYGLDKLTI